MRFQNIYQIGVFLSNIDTTCDRDTKQEHNWRGNSKAGKAGMACSWVQSKSKRHHEAFVIEEPLSRLPCILNRYYLLYLDGDLLHTIKPRTADCSLGQTNVDDNIDDNPDDNLVCLM